MTGREGLELDIKDYMYERFRFCRDTESKRYKWVYLGVLKYSDFFHSYTRTFFLSYKTP